MYGEPINVCIVLREYLTLGGGFEAPKLLVDYNVVLILVCNLDKGASLIRIVFSFHIRPGIAQSV
jgi:hypothetical protein